MASASAKVIGGAKLEWKLLMKVQSYQRAAAQGLSAWAMIVRNEAVRLVQKGPKSGELYVRGAIRHQASAPGQAPATDTGMLVRSIGWNIEGATLTADVFAGAAYAVHLEYGTRHMAARPFLAPALRDTEARGLAMLTKILSKAT